MLQPMDSAGRPDHGGEDDFDDIEWELCASTREAGGGWVPFVDPRLATETKRTIAASRR
jgi:hypothetical protein